MQHPAESPAQQMKLDAYSCSAKINITLVLLDLGGHLGTASQGVEITEESNL